MSHLTLDARAILDYLNESGYTNITSHQLKAFIKDLRKLIKYEECLSVKHFQNTTASYRAKVNERSAATETHFSAEKATTEIDNKRPIKRVHSEPQIRKPETILCKPKRTISCDACQTKPKSHIEKTAGENKINSNSSKSCDKMWIRSKQSTRQKPAKSCDPVELYHFYQKEWQKFRDQLPGENNHMELRWQIRNKLLGTSNLPQKKC